MSALDPDEVIARIDAAAFEVAKHLPFPVEVEADMGGTSAAHIELGFRTGNPDDPHDTVGIYPEDPNLIWWFEAIDANGQETWVTSDLNVDSPAVDVAAWIAGNARELGSPAADFLQSPIASPTPDGRPQGPRLR